ncbi:hypothetical protein TWF481_009538 [Arthrobotrys musiformis]|uniref:Uncharacterized protein n=1 Tax=Arthrobotrys musiformis TaxID=47236 RepID=A0AAV9W3Y9_9PEZI
MGQNKSARRAFKAPARARMQAFLPHWPEHEELLPLSPHDPFIAGLNPRIQMAPPGTNRPKLNVVPAGLYRTRTKMVEALSTVCNVLLQKYDALCANPEEHSWGSLDRLILTLQREERTDDRATGRNFVFKFDAPTLWRFLRFRHRFPLHNHLFDSLRILKLSVPHWLVIREVLCDGRFQKIGRSAIPLPHEYELEAEKYGRFFYTGREAAIGKPTVLLTLARVANKILQDSNLLGALMTPVWQGRGILSPESQVGKIEKPRRVEEPSTDYDINEYLHFPEDDSNCNLGPVFSVAPPKKASDEPNPDKMVPDEIATDDIAPDQATADEMNPDQAAFGQMNTMPSFPITGHPVEQTFRFDMSHPLKPLQSH